MLRYGTVMTGLGALWAPFQPSWTVESVYVQLPEGTFVSVQVVVVNVPLQLAPTVASEPVAASNRRMM
jgi:hypothetical protein